MDKIILFNSLLTIVICLIGIFCILQKKKELEESKPQWLKKKELRKRYIIPIDEYIAEQEKRKKGGWRL